MLELSGAEPNEPRPIPLRHVRIRRLRHAAVRPAAAIVRQEAATHRAQGSAQDAAEAETRLAHRAVGRAWQGAYSLADYRNVRSAAAPMLRHPREAAADTDDPAIVAACGLDQALRAGAAVSVREGQMINTNVIGSDSDYT